jgi:hypothetical protein
MHTCICTRNSDLSMAYIDVAFNAVEWLLTFVVMCTFRHAVC